MGNKQTAVEWLYERLERMIPITALYNIDKREYFEQAKQIEKANIIRARVDGDENHTFNSQMREEYAEDYYKENYGE
jgi:hypothetical protein